MALQLFDGSDSENDDISEVKINEEYARRFEYNKKREDLQRLEELKKKGLISSSSSSSSDSDEESESSDDEKLKMSRRDNKKFFDCLNKVKKKDPCLMQKDVKLFESDDSSEEESNEMEKVYSKNKSGRNPMYLKDVMAKHLIEEGPDFGDIEEKSGGKENSISENKEGKKTYVDEQEELKRAFLNASEKEGLNDHEGDFFVVKEKAGDNKRESDDEEYGKELEKYFSEDTNEDENSKFLKNYFMNEMWIDKKGENLGVDKENLEWVSESEESDLERQEEYEFRYQENQGDRVLGHARNVEGSVRKKTNARKEQRKSKEERMAIAQKEREEELKHLKNLKKQEMQEKVKKIMKTAGIHDDDLIPLSVAEIEEEFDPEEYDKMMKAAFDEKYYNAEDADSDFCGDNDEMEKPDFAKEDELLGLPKDWDACGSDDGFLAARERALRQNMENGSDHELQEEEENNEEQVHEEGKRKRKRKTALLEKARQAMMDEYYKLDYEDTIGDLKTRFKYAKTKPNRFGLSASELLMMDEKELNQYISLKKLAPYREEEWKLSKRKRYELKQKTKELLHSKSLDKKNKKKSRDDASKSSSSDRLGDRDKPSAEESNVETKSLSRKARRKQNTAHLKFSLARHKAYYGQQHSKSKDKRKQ
ncbi:LOW QUALITY PROTEIN: protein KRI1 homolog [Neltuma alba]|uniref:LOW QUALITY PROTEIN: protein KRI1 homolog n=1 Tax=Neltuma alba TaxID=207710 RepID=UPI0010A3A3B5|nr:LOW QUALITY PROTEIN: protein KRI1 homolog [Prosopis alba]